MFTIQAVSLPDHWDSSAHGLLVGWAMANSWQNVANERIADLYIPPDQYTNTIFE